MEGNGLSWKIFKTCNRKLEKKNQEHKENKCYVHLPGLQKVINTKKRSKERKIPAGIKMKMDKLTFNSEMASFLKSKKFRRNF